MTGVRYEIVDERKGLRTEMRDEFVERLFDDRESLLWFVSL